MNQQEWNILNETAFLKKIPSCIKIYLGVNVSSSISNLFDHYSGSDVL